MTTLYVNPGESLQEVINSAQDGDIIILRTGTHGNSWMDLLGKKITIQSEFPDDDECRRSTIINASKVPFSNGFNAGFAAIGSMFRFHNSETYLTKIYGLVLEEAYVTYIVQINGWGGGCISCESGASPYIKNCILRNSETYGYVTYGAAFFCEGYSADRLCIAKFEDCTFENCRSPDSSCGAGFIYYFSNPIFINCIFKDCYAKNEGAIRIYYLTKPVFTNCIFMNNRATQYYGGAVSLYETNQWFDYPYSVSFVNCTFINNTTGYDLSGCGGAIRGYDSAVSIIGCIFKDNISTGQGGALYLSACDVTIQKSKFIGNIAQDVIYGNAGAVYLTGCRIGNLHVTYNPIIENCLFLRNTANGTEWHGWYGKGGAINIYWSEPTITNCTFFGNTAYKVQNDGAVIYCEISCIVIIKNCIIWKNTPNGITVYDSSCAVTITYSDIQGGWEGEGNIDLDPKFADIANDDFSLRLTSPCFNTGTSIGAPIEDLIGNPRPLPYYKSGFDMGAYESDFNYLQYLWNEGSRFIDGYGDTYDPSVIGPSTLALVGKYIHDKYVSKYGYEYGRSLMSLLPRCKAWTRAILSVMFRLFHALGDELSRVQERMLALTVERNTLTTAELLDKHELDFGIPEEGLSLETYLDKRRAAINAKLLTFGRQNRDCYQDIADRLQFEWAYVIENGSFYCGWNHCGDPAGAQDTCFYWIMCIPFHPIDLEYYTDDYYSYLPRIPLLEDLIVSTNLYRPAHTIVLWDHYGPAFSDGFSFGFDCKPCDFYYPFGFSSGFGSGFPWYRRLDSFNYFGGGLDFGFNIGFDMNKHVDVSGYFTGEFDWGFDRGFDVFYGLARERI